jgi:hypothetical protein
MEVRTNSSRKVLRSILRILTSSVAFTVLLASVAAILIRQPVRVARVQRVMPRVDAARLRRHVAFMCTTGRPRDADHSDHQRIAVEYIANELLKAGARVHEERFLARRNEYANVVADFGPDDKAQPLLIVGAHYDTFGDLPGADDNASGSAALIELARLLGRTQLTHPIELVAFANEEPPFFASDEMGSAVHAASLVASKRRVEGMICLEMVGYFQGTQNSDSFVLDLLYPSKGDFVAVAGGWNDRALTRRVKKGLLATGMRAVSFTGPRTISTHRTSETTGKPAGPR